MQPELGKTIADPSTGTGGFLLATYDFIVANHSLDKEEKAALKDRTFYGNEIVANTRRLCLMNLFLHNIGEMDGEPTIASTDALVAESPVKVDYVLAS